MLTKKELKQKLYSMGIRIKGNTICKSDLKKVLAKENKFEYFPSDEIEEIAEDVDKSIATMKNTKENLEDIKKSLMYVVNAIDTTLPKIKALMADDITVENLKKFNTFMSKYIEEETRLFDELKKYHT